MGRSTSHQWPTARTALGSLRLRFTESDSRLGLAVKLGSGGVMVAPGPLGRQLWPSKVLEPEAEALPVAGLPGWAALNIHQARYLGAFGLNRHWDRGSRLQYTAHDTPCSVGGLELLDSAALK